MKKLFALIFTILLTLPVLLWKVDHLRGNGDNTVRQGFPAPEAALLLEPDYYGAVEAWFRESMPMAATLRRLSNWLDYRLFATGSTPLVRIGIHGWLFVGNPGQALNDPTVARQTARQLSLDLHAAESLISATGSRFVFGVIPDKATIYPEYLESGLGTDSDTIYRDLTAAIQVHPMAGYVDLEPVLKRAKLSGIDVFRKRSRQWSCQGARAAAMQLLKTQNPARQISPIASSEICLPPEDDLYRQLLGDAPIATSAVAGPASGPHAVDGPSAVIYGGADLRQLLPFITHAFNGLEVIDSALQPTFDNKVIRPESDLVLLLVGESELGRLHINLESLFVGAVQKMQGVSSHDIPLDGATALSQCVIDPSPQGLRIRTSGPGAFFAIPSSPGSTPSTFRMVKLTFAPSHQGRIIVRTQMQDFGPVSRNLSRETRSVIVPLPFTERVTIQVNPSEHPGVYYLERAELLSFYGSHPPPVAPIVEASKNSGDIYSGLNLQAGKKVASDTAIMLPRQPSPHPTDEQPELVLTDIRDGRIFQRQGKDADIVVSGAYTGISAPVEAQVVDAGDGSIMVPWTVVDGAPENGIFSGILRHVPQGGWYRLNVRSGITPWVVEKGGNRWGVGLLIGCIGQSNMREWFFTGQDHRPSDLLMVHRDGEWIVPDSTGNGALALGNRLTAALKIPVGLLDDSVNGSGLTPKAEWGKGFWLDTGPDSIYRRMVDGVNAAGGSLEYVLWMQGEADAARGTVTREEYREALERFVDDQIREDIKNGSMRPQLPFLMIPLVKRPTGKDKTCQWIRTAQMDASETIAECHLAALSIDLDNDLNRTFSVRYQYGAHPDTSRPVLDNTDLRLPLEPYFQ